MDHKRPVPVPAEDVYVLIDDPDAAGRRGIVGTEV
jgi:hypothetical protein